MFQVLRVYLKTEAFRNKHIDQKRQNICDNTVHNEHLQGEVMQVTQSAHHNTERQVHDQSIDSRGFTFA